MGTAALVGYHLVGVSWGLFLVLLLAPDVFMVGYLAGARFGARLYNLGHTYAGPLALGGLAFGLGSELAGAVALIWTAHIGLDRALGYGLKHATGFHDTHLSPTSSPAHARRRPVPAPQSASSRRTSS